MLRLSPAVAFSVITIASCDTEAPDASPQSAEYSGPAVFAETPQARLMKVLDLNGDGSLTQGEFVYVSDNVHFAEADLDVNGRVDEAELRTLVENITPLKKGYRGRQLHDPVPKKGPQSTSIGKPKRKKKKKRYKSQ